MRFLIFNIVVAGAVAFLVMGKPDLSQLGAHTSTQSLPLSVPLEQSAPASASQKSAHEVPPPLPPEAPIPKPKAAAPDAQEAVWETAPSTPKRAPERAPELPPAKEVHELTAHKAPRGESPGVTREPAAHAQLSEPVVQVEPAEVATFSETPPIAEPPRPVSRRQALYDLASDMERMFTEKMMMR